MKTSVYIAKTMIVAAAKACNEMIHDDSEKPFTHENMDELYNAVAEELSLLEAASLRQVAMSVYPLNSKFKLDTLTPQEAGKLDSILRKGSGNKSEPKTDDDEPEPDKRFEDLLEKHHKPKTDDPLTGFEKAFRSEESKRKKKKS